MIYYTCVGFYGGCDVKHRTSSAADRCCSKHHRQIQRGHGGGAYSDRRPVAVEDGVPVGPLPAAKVRDRR